MSDMWVKFHHQFEDWLNGDENVAGTTAASANGHGSRDLTPEGMAESAIKSNGDELWWKGSWAKTWLFHNTRVY